MGGRAGEAARDRFASSSEFYEWVVDRLDRAGSLTPSEREVCKYLVLGRQYCDIAKIRAVSIETVRWQVKQILHKLGIETARELLWALGQTIDDVRARARRQSLRR